VSHIALIKDLSETGGLEREDSEQERMEETHNGKLLDGRQSNEFLKPLWCATA
jgi:hypothetical protein